MPTIAPERIIHDFMCFLYTYRTSAYLQKDSWINRSGSIKSISCAYLIFLTLAFASAPQVLAGNLIVNNGSGSGSYPASTKVTIWANPQEDANTLNTTRAPLDANLPMRIFDRWVGDTRPDSKR